MHTVSSPQEAAAVKASVEATLKAGRNWTPADVQPPARPAPPLLQPPPALQPYGDVEAAQDEYLADLERLEFREPTITSRRSVLRRWVARLRVDYPTGPIPLEAFDRPRLERWHGELRREVTSSVSRIYVQIVSMVWRWLADHDVHRGHVAPYREPRLPRPPVPSAPDAPTWEQCAAALSELESTRYWAVGAVCYYTGLRIGQVIRLRRDDLDAGRRLLLLRPDLGKTRKERQGRVLPVCRHLVDLVELWGQAETLIPYAYAYADRPQMCSAWEDAGVPERLWRLRPHHAFRKALATELARRDVDQVVVSALLGHARGVTGDTYTADAALHDQMARAVALIPRVPPPVWIACGSSAADASKPAGVEPDGPSQLVLPW